LILVDHVRSTFRPVRALQRLIDRWSVRAIGDHQLRDPLDHLAPAGFRVEFTSRSRLGVIERLVARRPILRPHGLALRVCDLRTASRSPMRA
jgi:hypothetical protein